MQKTKKKPKAIGMASIAKGGGNIEVEIFETKTLGVSEYIIHGGKPCEGKIQSFIEMQDHEIHEIIEGTYDVFRILYFFHLHKYLCNYFVMLQKYVEKSKQQCQPHC